MLHLLAPMREKIIPMCGNMTAQHTVTGLDDGWLGTRSFVLYPSASEDQWDYLTHQPPNHATLGKKPHTESISGVGIENGSPSFFDAFGCAYDRKVEFWMPTFGGALAAYFGN
ncbi:hypothetical protein ARMSODRAFT_1026906 [Armillaria solidipes]|uniref:Uncharacterized protein n=1 Tax=Armillaria solidipes TaxID=1076256 RepID=A0A2H3AYV0_9AGAR|nr:hypothetical protein ARMSODRAFT_1026906 [Armillaria solidipes]